MQIRKRPCTPWGPEGDTDIVARPRSAEPASWPPGPESPAASFSLRQLDRDAGIFLCIQSGVSPPEPGCRPLDGPSGLHATSWLSLSPRIPPALQTPVLSSLRTIHQPELPGEPEGMAFPLVATWGTFSVALRLL